MNLQRTNNDEESTVLYREAFVQAGIPIIILDITEAVQKCTAMEQTNLENIDQYLELELSLKNELYTSVQLYSVNQAAFELLGLNTVSKQAGVSTRIFQGVYERIIQLLPNYLLKKKRHFITRCDAVNALQEKVHFNIYGDFVYSRKKIFLYAHIVDITKQKKFENIATSFIEKYYLLLKSIDDAILLVDVNTGMIVEANDAAIGLLDLQYSVSSYNHARFFKDADREKYLRFFQQRVAKNDSNEILEGSISIEGKNIPVNISINSSVVENILVAQVVLTDMSNKFKMEEGRKLLATAVDQAAESVIITDVHGNIEYVNPAFEEVSGYTFAEVLGKNPSILKSGETPSYYYKLMWEDISQGKVWRGTFKNKKKSGAVYCEEATVTPVKDHTGKVVNFVAVKRDITQHLILEKQIRQSQKMQAIGMLAGGIAHDFNNILTAILGYAELCQLQCDKESILHKNVEEIVRAADRAGQLVDQILKFSRRSSKELSSLKLSTIVKEATKLLRASFPANVDLELRIDADLYVKADPTQIHQIVMNLCTNAYQALEGEVGKISIHLFRKILSPTQGVEIGRLQPGNYACMQVEDSGKGIPKEYLQRIFEPYFTTKKMQEGTGLGLSVVHGIVNDHRGTVTVESTVGQGSSFTVYLPEAKQDQKVGLPQNARTDKEFSGCILVVDDEQPILDFFVQILQHLGFTVKACQSGLEAFEIFQEEDQAFDLVITDMGMPGMTGLNLTKQIRQINTDVPVILCTGYSEQVTAENYVTLGLDGYIAKPFTAESLFKEVSRVLQNPLT
ncbi:response regulator [Desulfobulbus rhabdoformis]|uniref:hybrid sensor histidine kinase/response regulator n=1 Tax=Desulfobulbus rhabdoformis TaxID=34032 RepID=UPI001964E4BB|nr:response regulator [Desulfobulbus rhabdoformis]MBM9612663.1 response regulator [Desulfobulbus rhabdoformis]